MLVWLQTVEPLPHKDLYRLTPENIASFEPRDIIKALRNGIIFTEALAALGSDHFRQAYNLLN